MSVKELIAELSKIEDQDMDVLVCDEEGFCTEFEIKKSSFVGYISIQLK